MKKIVFFVFCFCSVFVLEAQTDKGNTLVGLSSTIGSGADFAGLSFYNSKGEETPYKRLNLNVSPRLGHFIADDLVIGVDLYFSHRVYDEMQKTIVFKGGPFIRYYIPALNVTPFFEVSGAYGENQIMNETDKYEMSSNTLTYGGGIGLAFPIGVNTKFELMAGYVRTFNSTKDFDNWNDKIGITLGFVIVI